MKPTHLVSLLAFFGAAACGSSSTEPASTENGNSGEKEAPACAAPSADPGTVREDCGVFVAPSGSDTTGTGSRAAPYATLGRAIASASEKTLRVFACAGTYAENVDLLPNVSLHGGFECDARWRRGTTRSVIAPTTNQLGLRVLDAGALAIEDFDVVVPDAALPNGSSIAVLVQNTQVSFTRARLHAGAGAAGMSGSSAQLAAGPISEEDPDIHGLVGTASCNGGAAGNKGALAKVNPFCPTAIGGSGGDGLETNGLDGAAGAEMSAESFGVGGIGAAVETCQDGAMGALGLDGSAGLGARGLGTLSYKGYEGVAGADGGSGTAGQGGGGGGGGKGKAACWGASGGSGGAGGCGGGGGGGGAAGGSSFALVVLNASVSFDTVVLHTSAGGAGGAGSFGAAGAPGGLGGAGGVSNTSLVVAACKGGHGGLGGRGGHGGGGHGGHSAAIAFSGTRPVTNGLTFEVGPSGKGGVTEGAPESALGEDGVASEALELPQK